MAPVAVRGNDLDYRTPGVKGLGVSYTLVA